MLFYPPPHPRHAHTLPILLSPAASSPQFDDQSQFVLNRISGTNARKGYIYYNPRFRAVKREIDPLLPPPFGVVKSCQDDKQSGEAIQCYALLYLSRILQRRFIFSASFKEQDLLRHVSVYPSGCTINKRQFCTQVHTHIQKHRFNC